MRRRKHVSRGDDIDEDLPEFRRPRRKRRGGKVDGRKPHRRIDRIARRQDGGAAPDLQGRASGALDRAAMARDALDRASYDRAADALDRASMARAALDRASTASQARGGQVRRRR